MSAGSLRNSVGIFFTRMLHCLSHRTGLRKRAESTRNRDDRAPPPVAPAALTREIPAPHAPYFTSRPPRGVAMPDETPRDERFLTLRQVAEFLNVSVRYVRTLRQSGALPVVPLSPRCLRVRRGDLERMVE